LDHVITQAIARDEDFQPSSQTSTSGKADPISDSSFSSLGSSSQAQRAHIFVNQMSEGLKKIYESLSIGFQVNRAIRIEHIIIKRGLFGGFGLGVEEVRGLGWRAG
jgi:hypothetical protein